MPTNDLSLEQRLKRMEDIEAIRTLKSNYHTYVNDTAFEKVGDLFTTDASLNLGYLMPHGEPIVGRGPISTAFVAVSYTHLDVYKRQIFGSGRASIGKRSAT